MSDELRAELAHVHRKVDVLLLGLHHLLTKGHPDMSNKDDFLAAVAANGAALTANDTLLAGVVRGTGTLIASHGDGDGVFADALATVQAQGKQIATQGQALSALGNAITQTVQVEAPAPVDAPAPAPVADASAPASEAPVASDAAPAIPVAAPVVIPAPSA